MADIIQLELTPDQFDQAMQALEASNNGVKSFESTTPDQFNGLVVTGDISFDYSYDGKRLLTLTITSRNSFKAKFASLDTIRARMVKMLEADASA